MTKQWGNALLGKISLVTIKNVAYVRKADLDRLAARLRRGSKASKQPTGAEETISKEIKNARQARQTAFARRIATLDQHREKSS